MKEMKWYESQSEQGISFKLLKKYLERRIKSLSFRSLLVVIYIYITILSSPTGEGLLAISEYL